MRRRTEGMAKTNKSGRMNEQPLKESVDVENEDRISKLPDEILSQILSIIRPKYAARTCALSTRWRYLWALGPVLKFVMRSCRNQIDVFNYMEFVNRIMDRRNGSQIQEFHFHCLGSCVYDRLYSLIFHVLKLDVQVVDLRFRTEDGEGFLFPPVLFMNCASLVKLQLCGHVVLDVPANVCFPNLKILKLRFVIYSDDASISNLVAGCPLLEELLVSRFLTEQGLGDNMMTFSISTTSLKVLELLFSCEYDSHECDGEQCEYTTIIDTPNLECLRFDDHISANYSINTTLPFLEVARIDLERSCENLWDYGFHGDRVFGVMNSFTAVKTLFLSGSTLKSLEFGHDQHDPPVFKNLVTLAVGIDDTFGWGSLSNFLEKMPNLEVLIFPEGLVHVDYPGHNPSDEFVWNLPKNVPACLVFKIKTIQINNFSGTTQEELEFISYMLKNAKVMIEMKIKGLHGVDFDASVWDKILKFPKGSRSCHVDIS